jgi:N4-gp56 family major capsid protein
MAKTAFATGNALTKKLYEEELFEDTEIESYFSRFMSEGTGSIVHVKNDLTKSKGDRITYGIRMRLSGAGVTSGQTLEGNEESLVTYSDTILLEEYAHAVRDQGPLDRQRAVFSIDEESVAALKTWGSEKMDDLKFDALQASPTQYFSLQSGTVTGGTSDPSASVTTTDLLTPDMISFVKTWAKTGGNRANSGSGQTPLRPVNVDGKTYFVLLVHPDVRYDLQTNATFAQAIREAKERGSENPLFTGAFAIWNGVVIHDHEKIAIATNWGGASVPGSQNIFMGAQALTWANGKTPKLVAKEFDYGREHGYAWSIISGTEKPTFNSNDYGAIAVWTARTNVSGA